MGRELKYELLLPESRTNEAINLPFFQSNTLTFHIIFVVPPVGSRGFCIEISLKSSWQALLNKSSRYETVEHTCHAR